MKTSQPSQFVIVLNGKTKKAANAAEARRIKSRLDGNCEENYPWEKRRAHIYRLMA